MCLSYYTYKIINKNIYYIIILILKFDTNFP